MMKRLAVPARMISCSCSCSSSILVVVEEEVVVVVVAEWLLSILLFWPWDCLLG